MRKEQLVPKVTEEDIRRLLLREFGEADYKEALSIISKKSHREGNRLKAACIKLANKKIDSLEHQASESAGYYREMISEAEYPNYMKKWSSASKLSDEDYNKLVERDAEQYLAWFQK